MNAGIPAIAIVLLAASSSYLLRERTSDHYHQAQSYEDIYYLPPPSWLPVFSAGYDEALADLFWCRALIYFGQEVGRNGEVRHSLNYGDAIITLDPEFQTAYHWAAMSGMYRPQGVTVEEIKESISFLERGVERFPNSGAMAWDLGASLMYELIPRLDSDEEKERIRLRAAAFMVTASRLGSGPDWMVFTNATNLRRLGQTEAAIRHLEEMYSVVNDETVREQIGVELAALRDQAHADAFQATVEELESARRREFPYLDPGLFLLIREQVKQTHGEGGIEDAL